MKIRDRIKEFRRVKASELIPNPKNWRTHPKAQQDALRGVLSEIGYAGALLARETDAGRLMLIDGHLRAETTPDMEVPVLVLDVDEREADYLLATVDPLGSLAGRDDAALAALLQTVETESDGVRDMLDSLCDSGRSAGGDCDAEPRVEIADQLAEKWGVKPGQIWTLGEHRIMCGDSAKQQDLSRLLGDDRPQMVFTDPPYGVAIGEKNATLNSFQKSGKNLTPIKDDALSAEQLKERLLPAFQNLRSACSDDCTYFVCAPQGGELSMMMMMMMREAGLPVRHVLIWKKNQATFSMGRLDYDYQHEPILLTWGKRHNYYGKGAHRTSVWEIDKPRKSAEHPTMKPVELVENALLNNSKEGMIVADIYSGSGTTLMACERLGRRCRAMEIEPGYVAVAIERWHEATGGTPEVAQ